MAVLNKREDDIKNGVDGGGYQAELLNASGGTTTPTSSQNTSGKAYTPPKDNSSYYEALKNETYSTLLQSEIQASIARDQAMKYTQNQLNASGYGTQGLSESSNIGAYNNYMGSVNQAQSDYRNSLLGIKQQEQNAKEKEFQQLATLMEGAESTENLGRLFDAYGISVDENGNLGGDYYNSLDPQSQAQLKYLYDSYNKSYGTAEQQEKQQAFIEKYAVADYIGNGIEAGTPINDARLNETIRKFDTNDMLKNMQNGDVVEVVDGKNTSYMINNNGQWYYISKEGYQNATGTKYTASKDGIYSEAQLQQQEQEKQTQIQAEQQKEKELQDRQDKYGVSKNDKGISYDELSSGMKSQFPKNPKNNEVVEISNGVDNWGNKDTSYFVFIDGKWFTTSKKYYDEYQVQQTIKARNDYRTKLAEQGKY